MGQPVLHLWVAKPNESWWAMTERERDEMLAEVSRSLEAVGATTLVAGDCGWSNSEYEWFGVDEYPTVVAIAKHYAAQREIGFSRHVEEKTLVGTPFTSQAVDE